MRILKKFLLVLFVFLIISGGATLFWMTTHYVAPILMYHNVDHGYEDQANWGYSRVV